MEAPEKVESSDEIFKSSGRPWTTQALPIQAIMPDVLESLKLQKNLVLQAPTGAGKTTITPLAVFESGLLEGRVLVLQPRRITCINVARRMAELWGEPLGETVGYRIRHESVVSNRTQIEVITEGILVRMLHTNPSLEGVGCIFFDEFHERSIDSDLSFALCLDAQRRQDLQVRFVIMSATFGNLGDRVAELCGEGTRRVQSEGRCFPVDIKYSGIIKLTDFEPRGPQHFARQVAKVISKALQAHEGDMLVFLPGEREIMYTWIALNNMGIGDGERPRNLIPWAQRLIDTTVDLTESRVQVSTLYSTMDQAEQDEVLEPPAAGWRKVILATPIAESSITVPGVRIVVDSGLRKVKVTEPDTCMSYMHTVPISVAAADQRSGRAGRVSTGVSYRLWDTEQHAKLEPNDQPEIHRNDIANVVLDLAMSGAFSDEEIAALPWVDAPRVVDLNHGRTLLLRLQAFERLHGGRLALTERGGKLARFPVHPRVGHMIQQASEVSRSFVRDACDLAALLEEKELLRGGRKRHGVDIEARLDALQRSGDPDVFWYVKERVLLASEQLQRLAELNHVEAGKQIAPGDQRRCLSVLVAWAWPELLARAKPGQSNFLLTNGHTARVETQDPLCKCSCMAIASLTNQKIFWAMRASPEILSAYGVNIEDPVQHRILGGALQQGPRQATAAGGRGEGSEREGEALRLVVVRRYLLGKDIMAVNSVEDLVGAMESRPAQFPPSDVTAMLWDLAREEQLQEALLRGIAEAVVAPRAAEFSAAQLAEAACALTVGQAASPAAFAAIAEAVAPRLDELPLDSTEGNLSGLLWAFTAMGESDDNLFECLAQRAATALREFQPKVLSNVREVCFWSFHRDSAAAWSDRQKSERITIGFAGHAFFQALAPIVRECLDQIHPISCVYLMWSFSKAGCHDQELFDAIAERVGPVVSNLDRCGLTMFCWNYAYGGIENTDVYRLVAEDTLRPERMAEMAPRDTSGIAFAFAKAKTPHEELMCALLRHSSGLLRDGLAQHCYRGTQKSLAREVYVGDFSAVDGAVDAFDMVSLSDLLWACAEFQVVDPEFLDLCKDYMVKGLRQPERFSNRFVRYPQTLVRALHSFARLSTGLGGLFAAASPHVARFVDELWARDVCNLIWAWAVTGTRDPWLLAKLDRRLRALVSEGRMSYLWPNEAAELAWAVTELGLGDKRTKEALYEVSSAA